MDFKVFSEWMNFSSTVYYRTIVQSFLQKNFLSIWQVNPHFHAVSICWFFEPSSSYIYLHIHLDTEIIISSSRVFMCYNSINLYSRCVASFATFNIIDKIFISFTLYPWGFGLNTLCPWVFSLFTLCLWDYEMLIEHRIFSL